MKTIIMDRLQVKVPRVVVIDFETSAIAPRPHYPPVPVGVAITLPTERKGKYYAWGHPDGMGNNCTKGQAVKTLKQVMRDHLPLYHNAGFDLDIAETHLGMTWPAHWHDTLLMGFLHDPDSYSLSLKPLAERHLGEPPEEQDRLKEWIIANVIDPETGKPPTKKTAGAFISLAPVALVAPYAIGDCTRTRGLFQFFWNDIMGTRLKEAYERELKVTRTLIRMERRGVPVDVNALEKGTTKYQAVKVEVETPLLKKLKVPKKYHDGILYHYDEQEDFSWSGKGFAERLVASGLVDHLPLTEKGNASTSYDSLVQVMPAKLAKEFEVRSQLQTCLNTFMKPWLAQGRETNGVFHARFNQVRNGDEWGVKTGARTGRLSMTPNLQNMIRGDKDPRVPKLREYIAHKTKRIGKRDYSQQELRILAHYEDGAYQEARGEMGPFRKAYEADPTLDAHVLVKTLIQETTGLILERRPTKDLNFGLIYGQGLALTAEKMGLPLEEAKRARNAHAKSLPGIPILQKELKERVKTNQPIWTWGGRRYFCEPPVFAKNRWISFDYKMLNKLIQGSAADCTKQAMVNYDETSMADEFPLILQIHDELLGLISGKSFTAARHFHKVLDECMADVDFSVPMLSDGSTGLSYGTLVDNKWEKK